MLRKLEIILPADAAQELRGLLAEKDLLANWQQAVLGERIMVHLLVETPRAEKLLDALEGHFGHLPDFRVIVLRPHVVLPAPKEPEREKERDDAGETDEAKEVPPPQRVARAELLEQLSAGAEVGRVYLVTVVLSSIVASVGLVRDNIAVIIGAMVIAPLLTPNMALALAATLGDLKLARKALRTLGIGIALALLFAIALGMVLDFDPQTPQVLARTDVSVGDVILALASGAAGALAFTAGVSAGLVGVMVAVALLPPLIVTGLYTGAGESALALRAVQLLAINVVSVNLAAILTFLWQGLRPRTWWEADRARRATRVAVAIWGSLLALLIGLLWFGG
jgi:uncharacterized hydrophobic protein (TIGR00341 family)